MTKKELEIKINRAKLHLKHLEEREEHLSKYGYWDTGYLKGRISVLEDWLDEIDIMKPEIGTKVYCIYNNGVLIDNIAFIGSESFIIESFGSATYEDSWEWYYEDYDKEWFTDFNKAKEKLLSIYSERYGDKFKIVKVSDTWYQIFEEDEI